MAKPVDSHPNKKIELAKSAFFFEKRKRVEPDWVIGNFLKRRNTAFILGEPKKACKSWFLLNLAWDLSEGKPAWNLRKKDGSPLLPVSRPMNVVYFTQEDSEDDFHDRYEIMRRGGRKPNNNLWFIPKNLEIAFDTKEGMDMLKATLSEVVAKTGNPIDLIQFDPMRRMHSQEENNSEVIVRIWKILDWLHKKHKTATLFTHHLIKPTGDWFDPSSPSAARGSGDIYAGGDSFINVVPLRTEYDGEEEMARIVRFHFESKRSRTFKPLDVRVSFEDGTVGMAEKKAKQTS